jgi:hypothetical protein
MLSLKTSRSQRRLVPSAARRRYLIGLIAIVLPLSTFHSAGQSAGAGGQAAQTAEVIKLGLEPYRKVLYPDQKPEFKLQLLDAGNRHKNAPEDFEIKIEAQTLEGVVLQTKSVLIREGTDSEKLDFEQMRVTGVIKIKAKHEKLLEGGTFISIIARPMATPKKKPSKSRKIAQDSPFLTGSFFPSIRPVAFLITHEVRAVPASLAAQDTVPSGPASPPGRPTLTIKVSPERLILADGIDPVQVCAFLTEPFETETRIRLFSSAGRLDPGVIVIPPNEISGCTTLTSDRVCEAHITYVGSTPDRRFQTGDDLRVRFKAPITTFELRPAPISIPLIDIGRISIILFNGKNAAATSEEMKFTLTVESGFGAGEIIPLEIRIPEGEFQNTATFIPKTRGPVIISASTAGFPTATAQLLVLGVPPLLLILTVLGGFSGGLLAYWVGANQKWWRIVLGVVTGCVFYWALIFEVLPGLRHSIVLNEISAYILPTLGGWLGTEVFGMALKRIGIGETARQT